MAIDTLTETIASLQETEKRKRIIFAKIYENLANLQAMQNYEGLKSYMKMVQRAVTVVDSVIASQKIRFRKNEKMIAKLDVQIHALNELKILSRTYETNDKREFLNGILGNIISVIRNFIKSSEDLVSEKSAKLAA